MRTYEGAVLFVDILGVGALTTGKYPIVAEADFEAIGWSYPAPVSNQGYCAALLSTFRAQLLQLNVPEVRIAQLSDCAFLWSENVDALIRAARKIQWSAIEHGVLLRGGLSYGEIVEPDKVANSIGAFVCGEAVTRAATLEKNGRGARLFVDTKLPGKRFQDVPTNAFKHLSNATDFTLIDEFLWFCVPPVGSYPSGCAKDHLADLSALILQLRYSPMFRWNATSPQGQLQLGATIERISIELIERCKVLDVEQPEFALMTCDQFQRAEGDSRNRVGGHTLAGMMQMVREYRQSIAARRKA